ncbi:hypothetical protein LB561_07395 [Mesorhizobium sp. B292B1B]|uniref:hypothetical protein n=1 Tax=unclassified Mesorhizobium TaxID=325217 RepID=UPI001128189C|nr:MULTISPECIES: hypothetical protein [unclassified Mesorhizobium]MCA0011312.1 hypothetical protein [Mesorhizobium sp. B294B1A1]MCA0037116.1 hypothetical protein [Mesorhizobium sp. B292B1B]TPM37629.1 hypothetical protein FJ964_29460 [Mesorhizobium sp. B2-3-2]
MRVHKTSLLFIEYPFNIIIFFIEMQWLVQTGMFWKENLRADCDPIRCDGSPRKPRRIRALGRVSKLGSGMVSKQILPAGKPRQKGATRLARLPIRRAGIGKHARDVPLVESGREVPFQGGYNIKSTPAFR